MKALPEESGKLTRGQIRGAVGRLTVASCNRRSSGEIIYVGGSPPPSNPFPQDSFTPQVGSLHAKLQIFFSGTALCGQENISGGRKLSRKGVDLSIFVGCF